MLAWRQGLKGRSEDFRALLEFTDLGCLPVLAGCRGGAREGNPDAFLWGLKTSHWIYMAGTSRRTNIAAAVCHTLGSLHLLERGDSGAPAVDEERRRLAAVIRSELLSLEGTPGNRRMVDEHGEMGIKDLLAILGRAQAALDLVLRAPGMLHIPAAAQDMPLSEVRRLQGFIAVHNKQRVC